jgi:hypothetical protein
MSPDQAPRGRLREVGDVSSRRHQVKVLESAERTLAHSTTRSAWVTPNEFPQLVELRAALTELFELLEEHGPMWYKEIHHNRAIEALISVDCLLAHIPAQSQPAQD